jgi:hypothetical protein
VIIRGAALAGLLAELAAQRLARPEEPARSDRFDQFHGSVIRQLIVERAQDT